jgi:hypothetical protein
MKAVSGTGEYLDNAMGKAIGMNPAKFERCVKEVQARGGDVNAYAVCTAAGTRNNPDVMTFAKKDAAYAYARLMEAEGWVAKVARRGFKWGVELTRSAANPYNYEEAVDSFARQFAKAGRGYGTTIQSARARLKKWRAEGTHAADIKFYQDAVDRYERLYKRKGNPESAAAEMYESFHGIPSEEVTEFITDEHYHENLAELGVLCGLLVETEYAGTIALAFSGYVWDKKEGAFDLPPGKQNPLFGSLFGTKTTTYHAKGGTTTTTGKLNYKGKQIVRMGGGGYQVPSIDSVSTFDNLTEAKRFVDFWSKNPKIIDGYPVVSKASDAYAVYDADDKEIVAYAPGNLYPISKSKALRERGTGHKVYYVGFPLSGGRKGNPDPTSSDTTLLTSNENGTQLFLVGGDQSVDLDCFKFEGPEAEHESIILGNVAQVVYHTSKIFEGKREEYDYFHHFSEDTDGPLPVLRYDAVNQRLHLDGGSYKIEKPLLSTSPGIEN